MFRRAFIPTIAAASIITVACAAVAQSDGESRLIELTMNDPDSSSLASFLGITEITGMVKLKEGTK